MGDGGAPHGGLDRKRRAAEISLISVNVKVEDRTSPRNGSMVSAWWFAFA